MAGAGHADGPKKKETENHDLSLDGGTMGAGATLRRSSERRAG
jgi:hypothetical protein